MLYCYMKAVSRTCETTVFIKLLNFIHGFVYLQAFLIGFLLFLRWKIQLFQFSGSRTYQIYLKCAIKSSMQEQSIIWQFFISEFNSDFSLKIFLVNIRSSISVIPKKYTHTYFHDKVTISTRKKCDENLQKINLIQLRN